MNIIDKINLNNSKLITLLENSLKQNKIAHAFILSSESGTNIDDETIFLISSIIENKITNIDHSHYSDLITIDGSKKIIKKEQVINSINKMQQTPLDEKGFRILFIKNIENGNKQSLNSLLKFLEEPKSKTYIIMTTNNLFQVLDTIKSRSQIISLKRKQTNLLENELNEIKKPYKEIISLITGSLSEAKKFVKSSSNLNLLEKIVETFITSEGNINKLIISLDKIITKSNYEITLKVIRIIFSDIWKNKLSQQTVTNLTKTLNKYININFQRVLEAIGSFNITINKNGNFELAKTRLLLEIGENNE